MERYYTINDAARILSVTRETLYRWMAAGRLRYVHAGNRRRIRESDIQAFIKLPDQRQVEPSHESR